MSAAAVQSTTISLAQFDSYIQHIETAVPALQPVVSLIGLHVFSIEPLANDEELTAHVTRCLRVSQCVLSRIPEAELHMLETVSCGRTFLDISSHLFVITGRNFFPDVIDRSGRQPIFTTQERMDFYYKRVEKFFEILGLFLHVLMPNLQWLIVRKDYCFLFQRKPGPPERCLKEDFVRLQMIREHPPFLMNKGFQQNNQAIYALHKGLGERVGLINKSSIEAPALITEPFPPNGNIRIFDTELPKETNAPHEAEIYVADEAIAVLLCSPVGSCSERASSPSSLALSSASSNGATARRGSTASASAVRRGSTASVSSCSSDGSPQGGLLRSLTDQFQGMSTRDGAAAVAAQADLTRMSVAAPPPLSLRGLSNLE